MNTGDLLTSFERAFVAAMVSAIVKELETERDEHDNAAKRGSEAASQPESMNGESHFTVQRGRPSNTPHLRRARR